MRDRMALVIRFLLFLVLLLGLLGRSKGQSVELLTLNLHGSERDTLLLQEYLRGRKEFDDSTSLFQQLGKAIKEVRRKGFWLANIDSVSIAGSQVDAFFFLGDDYDKLELHPSEDLPRFEQVMREGIPFDNDEPISHRLWERWKERVLEASENNGFPFARLWLDSLDFGYQKLSAEVNYDPGSLIVFDSLSQSGSLRIKKHFVSRYLQIVPGRRFNQQKVEQINQAIAQLPYAKLERAVEVRFESEKAFVKLGLEPVKANQFDAVVGVQPNSGQGANNVITGQVLLDLYNPFGAGKHLYASWQSFKPQSQRLELTYTHPVIFRTPLELHLFFNLLREDSTFSNVDRGLELRYDTYRFGKFGLSYQWLNSWSGEVMQENQISSLPDFARSRFISYGFDYAWQKLDNRFLPRKGWEVRLQAQVGNKEITPDGSLPDTLYDEISLESVQYVFLGEVGRFFTLGKQSTILFRNRFGWVVNNQLFLNDMLRIGGLKSLRGFDENAFFVSGYNLLTIEPRLYFEAGSYLFLLTDGGWMNNRNERNEFPIGAGAGINFATKAGAFNLVYALGSSEDQSFAPNRAKVHFGYSNRF